MRGNVRIVRAVASMVLGLGLVKRVDELPTQDWLEDPPPSPEVLCKVLRASSNTTPVQKAAWDDDAARENMRAAADPLQN
jgi:hypothetical protein